MGWLFLVAAIVLEVAGTFAAKQANGFTNLAASALMMLCYGLAFSGLTFAMKSIDMSIAYPVWTGVAILAVSILGVTWFRESMSLVKGFSIFLLLVGLIGLTMGDQAHS
ncbi:MAG: multidrug efflux SMR transporter [Leptolyngbya sp. BL-A-14]